MKNSLQFHYKKQTYLFSFKIGFFLLCCVFFCLCLLAGIWQVQRYHYKKSLVDIHHLQLSSAPKVFSSIQDSPTPAQFQNISVQGQYINTLTVLIQNGYYQGKPRYEVLTPLKIKDEKRLLLIDRGWTAQPENIENVTTEQHILGYIKLLNEWQFILGKNILYTPIWPLVMQKIDIQEISHLTHAAYFPYVLRLDPRERYGFTRNWVVTTMPPQRHMGYAIQWFALALVLFIAYFCFSCERITHDATQKE